jgi:polyisoprenoid-binding protein YceI
MTSSDAYEAGATGSATATALAGPATYQLDQEASAVTFTHKTMWGLASVRGRFTDLSGTAEIRADGSAHGRLEIGTASLNTKNRKRDEHLRSADFFHAAAHPKIVVDVTQAATSDGSNVQASGTLTVAGRSRPLTLTARIAEASGQSVTLTADAQIDRADFGMTWNQLGMLKGTAQIHVVARFVTSAAA